MRLNCLSEAKVRFFLGSDVADPIPRKDGKPYRAHLIKNGGKDIWIPKSVSKEIEIVDKETGEIHKGYYVKEWWRNRNLGDAKRIRMSKTDYKDLPTKYLVV